MVPRGCRSPGSKLHFPKGELSYRLLWRLTEASVSAAGLSLEFRVTNSETSSLIAKSRQRKW